MFSCRKYPSELVAPLVKGPLLTIENEQCDQPGMPDGYWYQEDIKSPSSLHLTVSDLHGQGSTGTVFLGSWQGKAIAVKITEGKESQIRMHSEHFWYARIAERKTAQHILPTFVGWLQHTFFDVLVLSYEGTPLASWEILSWDERYVLPHPVSSLDHQHVSDWIYSPWF
jgi:hypothetical protein